MMAEYKGKRRRRKAAEITLTITALALATLAAMPAIPAHGAPAGFQEGVADYNSGNYARALGTFQSYKATYPSNALVHYYIALSQQGLGHIEQAKGEYQWVVQSRDPKLAAQAAAGLAQLSHVRTTGSGGGGSSASRMPTASAPPGGSVGQNAPHAKVSKVLDFWATW